MSFRKKITTLVLLSIPYAAYVSACTNSWSAGGGGDWNTVTNWNGGTCFPNGVSDTATFPFINNTSQTVTIPLSTTITVDSLTFNSAASYIVTAGSGVSSILNFQAASPTTPIPITVVTGQHTIEQGFGGGFVKFPTANPLLITVEDVNGSLTFHGVLELAPILPPSTIEFIGPGSLNINDLSAHRTTLYSGNGDVTINAGGVVNVLNIQNNSTAIAEVIFGAQGSVGGFTMNDSTLTATNQGTMSGTGLGTSIPSTGDFTINNSSLTNSNLGSVTASGTGSLISTVSGDFILNSGSVTNTNNFAVSAGSGAVGVAITSGGNVVINSGIFTSQNNNNVSGTNTNGSQIMGVNFIMNGGNCAVVNISGIINGANTAGSILSTSQNFTINNGNFIGSNLNATTITQGVGAVIKVGQALMMNGGSLSLLNQTNLSASGSGSAGVSLTAVGDIDINSAIFLATNSGSISSTGVNGSQIMGTNFVMNGGTATINNSGVINAANAIGSSLATTQNFTINNGNFFCSNLNAAMITQGIGSAILVGQDFVLNRGSLTIINQASVNGSSSIGSALEIVGNTTVNSSVVNLQNTGNVTGTNTGSLFQIGGFLTMQGSTLTNSNSGQVTGGGFGSLVKAKNIILNNSTIVNDGNILTDMLSIDPSSTYSGNGFISNLTPSTTLVVTNNGTVLPGDAGIGGAPATMTIDGSYVQTPTGTLVIDFDNATSYSKLMITGSAQLAGTMEVAETLDANIIPGQIFQVLQANGGVTGTFSTFVDFNIPYAAPHAIYFPNSVEIFFTPITQNYINLSRPIFSSVNETYTRLTREMERVRLRFTKPKEEKVSISKKQTSSAWYDEAPRYVAFQEDVVSEEKRERLTESMEVGKERPGNFYIGPKGQVGNVVSKEDMQGYSYWTAGVFTGFDYAFSEIGIGLLAEYERVEADIGKKWGKFDIDTAHVDAYATYAPSGLSELSFNAIVGGGYEWYKLKRNINQTVPHTLKGAPRGAEWDALFGMEYSFRDSVFTAMPERLQIIPMASVEYMYLHISDYTEHGFQPHALHVSKQNVKSLRSNLGFRISYIWHRTENITIYPQVNFNWQREYLDKERNIDFLPVEFSDFGFSLDLPKVGRNTALAGIDVLLTMFQRHGLEAGYDFEYNPVYHTHFLYLSYNLRF